MTFGNNVFATSSTTYSSLDMYYIVDSRDSQLLEPYENYVLYNRYINIPIRIGNYCNNFPSSSNGNCPLSYNANIGMVGLSNGANSKPYKYYNTSVRWVDERFRNGNGSTYTYATYNTGASKINYGYFNNNNDNNNYTQTHKQNTYYLIDNHVSYPFRQYIRSYVDVSDVTTTSTTSEPGFSPGNIIMYKMRYMLGPTNGNYGDGTWSYTSPGFYANDDEDYLEGIYSALFLDVRRNSTMWIRDSNNYDNYDYINKSWHLQNNHFGATFDGMEQYPGCSDSELCGNTNVFQGSNPLLQFLSLYEHTYYDKTTGKKYYKRTTIGDGGLESGSNNVTWYENSQDVYGKVSLHNSSSDTFTILSTSTVLMAQPYNYKYNDNGTTYYSTVWFLDIYFFAYIDDIYDFDRIRFDFYFDNQLSTYGNINQLDLISPDTYLMVIGSGTRISDVFSSMRESLRETISNIPLLGPLLTGFLSVLLGILFFIFMIFYYLMSFLVVLPSWLFGGFVILFISIFLRTIIGLIRGG